MQEMWKAEVAGVVGSTRSEEALPAPLSRGSSRDNVSVSRSSRRTATNTHNVLFDSIDSMALVDASRQSSVPLLPVATGSNVPSTTLSTRDNSHPIRDSSQMSHGRVSWVGHTNQVLHAQSASATRSEPLDPSDSMPIGLAMPPAPCSEVAHSSRQPSATLKPSRDPSPVATRYAPASPSVLSMYLSLIHI